MKLTQRINVILLPVIAGVFVVTSWILNSTMEDQTRLVYEEQLEQTVNNSLYRINYETNLADSIFSQIVNSHEYANYIADPSVHVLYDALDILLNRQREQVRSFMPGLVSIQILNSQGGILFSADDRELFTEASLPPIPSQHQHWLNPTQGIAATQESFLFETANGEIHLGRLHTFNSEFLSTATRRYKDDNKTIYFLIVINMDFLRLGTPNLQKEFEGHYSIDLRINNNSHQQNVSPSIALGKNKKFMSVTFTHPLFLREVKISEQFISQQLQEQKSKQWFLTIALILFSYSTLLSLIHRQIINPVLKLTNQVRSGKSMNSHLQAGNDEVSELHNSYTKLLEEVEKLAQFDPLTNLANRASFKSAFARVLTRSLYQNEPLAILYIDLDNFKQVNDHYGHDVGDQLLVEFSSRLLDSIRSTDACSRVPQDDAVARLAGDEFAIVLADANPDTAALVAQRILDLFKGGFTVGQQKHNVKASIGIAIAPNDGEDVSDLMLHADAAMYQAKSAGRNCYQFFTQKIADAMKEKLDIQDQIAKALENQEFYLMFMPIYSSQTLAIESLEVLLRSTNPLLNKVGPEKFIPVAESTGLIKKIDLWVVEQALKKLHEFNQTINYQNTFSINMSSVELHNKEFPLKVGELIQKYHINPKQLDLEVTETSLTTYDKNSIQVLNELKALGLSLSLDDFGTGYTAFNQLIHYPVDHLKIDRSFVAALNTEDEKNHSMLEIIISMSSIYGLKTVAEGVETQQQLDYLIELGCDYLQGYYLSKPLIEADLLQLLASQSKQLS
ncbi:bifunctional diguanylate cyclase/phosphodiesterase [Dasania sp. GY-MA-18]|uniref:Bifunctional diguanylate cyclase/phosphodiesterase n=1 Tax=Dasania phycosphaerae TaxID=2950436 RepID=A0A9J6RHB5_9GAMM|nr:MULTISPECIES: bifunctional diguanylate cyclase/phosphodiesterase [Dasania]MCR8921318.1 bifunctional diguanylate cyclase/phosphodiesterase [Dasania sp. GY-MA-18]MCZ0863746.1 bifunctional diguanylate cyclase/phosphodiesterase [Dasania phycosphaerae]MCZ0867474.1 bifunctional diguanylate cyclase/phosphodiesterase [Dasania phycosphaerae]